MLEEDDFESWKIRMERYIHAKSSTPPQPSPKPTTQAAQTHKEALMATMQQLSNLLSGFQKQFPPTNNQLRASSNLRSQATVQA
nr:hypothetical protein [Tanacetum cinerariifolium]